MNDKTRNLLQYNVEPDDTALICKYGKNHGRICKVLHKWDNRAIMSNDFSHLSGLDCFVVMSLGSPFVYESPATEIYYAINKTHLIVVEAKHLKRVARSHEVNWKLWK
jgi:hypothetical protein